MDLSRKFSSAECNYSNIKKEALAIVGQKVPLKIRPQTPGILIQPEKGVTQSKIVKNFKVGNQNHDI